MEQSTVNVESKEIREVIKIIDSNSKKEGENNNKKRSIIRREISRHY